MALQLPDYGRMSSGFTAIAEETSKLPNVEAMNNAQALVNINNTLIEIRRSMNTLRTDLTTQITAVRTELTTQINTLRTDLTNRMDTSEINIRARIHNSTIRNQGGILHPLSTHHGVNGPNFPPNFPATPAAIASLTRPAHIDPLLAAYNLPITESPAEKRRRFAEHIGVEPLGV